LNIVPPGRDGAANGVNNKEGIDSAVGMYPDFHAFTTTRHVRTACLRTAIFLLRIR
jgi:hypothetical protein